MYSFLKQKEKNNYKNEYFFNKKIIIKTKQGQTENNKRIEKELKKCMILRNNGLLFPKLPRFRW